ncbi:MAG: Fe-S cluster assembly ATPase SufC [bacterium]
MLSVKDLNLSIQGQKIISDFSFEILDGEIVTLMGPNGSGKSSLAESIMGNPDIKIDSGEILFNGTNLKDLSVTERAKLGIFLAFQYPIEIPGVDFINFLRMAYNGRNDTKLNVFRFRELVREKMKLLKMDEKFLERNINEGFSGGEKKKAEILQMAILNPKLVILDETDSGLDIDALKAVFEGIMSIKEDNPKMSILLITHYNRVFEYVKPDKVIVINKGIKVKVGGDDILKEIERDGYKGLK